MRVDVKLDPHETSLTFYIILRLITVWEQHLETHYYEREIFALIVHELRLLFHATHCLFI